jgi:hypothetical protein
MPIWCTADEMLVSLVTLVKKLMIGVNASTLRQEVSSLEAQRDYLAEFGIDGYFPKSFALMSSLLEG